MGATVADARAAVARKSRASVVASVIASLAAPAIEGSVQLTVGYLEWARRRPAQCSWLAKAPVMVSNISHACSASDSAALHDGHS
jgi:hypothetical protein